MLLRRLTQDQVGLVWTIDRREVIERVYRLGVIAPEPDPALYAEEPEDIHLLYTL